MKKILSFRPLFYLAFILFFALLPIEAIREHSFCLLYNVTDFKCASCGVTRAFCSFLHFDFASAAQFNPVFTYSIFPLCIFLMLEDTVAIVLRLFLKSSRRSFLEQGFCGVFNLLMGKK